mgnify:FL=1
MRYSISFTSEAGRVPAFFLPIPYHPRRAVSSAEKWEKVFPAAMRLRGTEGGVKRLAYAFALT